MKSISQVAKLTGVSIRTLQYYDEIGLLKPSELTAAGYRMYDDNALQTLQQILFFKELGFPLKEIKEILEKPDFDRIAAFKKQKELFLLKRMLPRNHDKPGQTVIGFDSRIKLHQAFLDFFNFWIAEIPEDRNVITVDENHDLFPILRCRQDQIGKWPAVTDVGRIQIQLPSGNQQFSFRYDCNSATLPIRQSLKSRWITRYGVQS